MDAGVIRTASDETDGARLRQLHAALASLLAEHALTGSAWSASSSSAMCRAMTVGQARGVALLAAAQAGLAVDEPTPNEVKQAVCGNGAADKEQVAGMVARLLGVSLAGVPMTRPTPWRWPSAARREAAAQRLAGAR